MRFSKSAVAAVAAASTASAQRPTNTSICDYYTTALLKENTADNQYTLLTLVVNTVVIGNYTQPNVGITVPGILAPATVNGTDVNLLPYFNGGLASSNRGGSKGVSINFLDGGGAEPLMKNMPANDDSSMQYFLLTHLYQFFGSLLGCSMQGMAGFDAYAGHGSMYEVHKFMDLNPYELGYFIEQVAMAAASFGVAEDDLTVVGKALNSLFAYRCAPETTVIPAQGALLQSICIDGSCPIAENATCSAYDAVMVPTNSTTNSTATAPGSLGTATVSSGSGSTATGTSSSTSSTSTAMTAGAMANAANLAAVVGAVAAFML
ncbi:putative Heme haloperoxidase family profile domain-containing protein [Seiridium unicorne]|uniref:Heme haloperoxidase family profile domain-containing protein n=1 Tax=Seiridium unicorne TaxID=138068 RepID=A0ABR2VIT8_9PEZI